MYVTRVPNRNSPPAVLLRESFRVGDKVKSRTLANLSHWPEAKIEALRAVLNQGVYMHAGFAGATAPLTEARKGWRHAFGRYCLPRVRAQVREAQRAFAEDGTPESSERLVSLQRHLHELQALVSGADEPLPGGPSDREQRP